MNAENLAAIRPGPGAALINDQPDRPTALAFIADDESEAALRGGLAELLGSLQIRRGGIKTAVRVLEQEPSPRVLVVDVSGEEDPIQALDKLALVCSPDTKVLAVGERNDIGFYRDLTQQLGVHEYLPKPLTRDGVSSLIGAYLAGVGPERSASQGGRIVAVCGARGGVGTTTVAVNLALHIAEKTHGHVALLDLHLRGGHTAMMLGSRPGAGLRLALEDPERADSLFLERVALPFGDRLRVIAAEEPFDAEPTVTPAGVARVMQLLRQRFNITVVDLPTPPSAAEREVLQTARQVLIVLNADIGSLRDAKQLQKLAASLAGAGRAMMVLNRASAPGSLKMGLVEEGLGSRPEIVIPDLPRQLPKASNMGQPALPRSDALRRALAPLTQEIAGVRLEEKGGLLRLGRR